MDIMCPIVDAETDVPASVTSMGLPLSDLCCDMDNNCNTSGPDYTGFVLDGFCDVYGA
jgi:hypothetical protein